MTGEIKDSAQIASTPLKIDQDLKKVPKIIIALVKSDTYLIWTYGALIKTDWAILILEIWDMTISSKV